MILPRTKKDKGWVSINFAPNQLTLCALQKSKRPGMLFDLIALVKRSITCDEFDEGILHNPTAIGAHINHFLCAYTMRTSPIAVTVQGASIEQAIALHPASTIDSNLSQSLHTATHHTVLDTQDNDHVLAYTCRIDRSLIMQYQLLAISHALNVQSISTDSMAYINLYRHIHTHSKPPTHDSRTITPEDFIVEQSMLIRTLTIDEHIHSSDYRNIVTALGAVIPLI